MCEKTVLDTPPHFEFFTLNPNFVTLFNVDVTCVRKNCLNPITLKIMSIFKFQFIPISVVKKVISLKKNLLKMTILLSRKRDDPRGFYGTVHVKFKL